MERAFIIKEGSAFYNEHKQFTNAEKNQKAFVKRFCEDNGIESTKYRVSGTGAVNEPFTEANKHKITFGIIPTEADKLEFGGMMRKPDERNGSDFKKASKIAKRFAVLCTDESIVVNLLGPRVGDCFRGIGFARYSTRCFEHDGKLYVSVQCETLTRDETPDGFEEIKMSELYRVIEEIEGHQ